jgi:mannosidase alpha-like ER degradation enhancer 2
MRLALAFALLAGCATSRPAAVARPIDRAALAERVRAEFLFSWSAYKASAWGHDELKPLSKAAYDWYPGGTLLMTPLDSLDSLFLLGFEEEARSTKDFIVEKLSFDQDIEVKNFEITIRVLGGLLSAYQLMGDERLLALADDLGRRLLPAFDSPTGMPYMYVNLRSGKTRGAQSNPAEIGTLLLEFGTLARLTKKETYYQKAKHALVQLYRRRSKIGLVGETISVETGEWTGRSSHIDGGIDSYYEYLLKAWLLFGDEDCRRMWLESVEAVNRYVADETPAGLWYGEVDMDTGQRKSATYGALQAFFPAVLALHGDLDRARRLQESSFRMWTQFGAEPDEFDYRTLQPGKYAGYQLRPEIIESAYYLHTFTKDPRYLIMGRTILDDLVARCRTGAGYTILETVVSGKQGDKMPSYFLAETLKYLYLLFAPPEVLDLRAVVFNTEAHPLRRTW